MAYPQYPPGYPSNFEFDYRTTPPRPSPQGAYAHHRYSSFNTPSPRGSPSAKAHARRVSQEYYSSARAQQQQPQYSTPHTSPRGYSTYQQTPLRPDYAAQDPYASERPRSSRRPATSGGPRPDQPQPQPRQRRPSTAKTPPKHRATEEDARRAGIPAGYSVKNWDPTEEPIKLLGSVFDANSLGKWIYDWTVYRYGAATPFSDMAGELWLQLIQLAGKVKRADHLMPRIRRDDSRELVEDFLESGERLWIRFKKLLKICEDYMWRAAKRGARGDGRPLQMGKDTGCEFVDSLFGRDRELAKTEQLMAAMRLWGTRFEANCEDILRNPTA